MSKIIDADIKVNPRLTTPIEFPIIFSQYKMLLQEIDVLFNTTSSEVLCSWYGWPNIRDYIFRTNVSESTLRTNIESLIKSECPSSEGMDTTVEVQFINGSLHDIAVITVTIKEYDTVVANQQYYVG